MSIRLVRQDSKGRKHYEITACVVCGSEAHKELFEIGPISLGVSAPDRVDVVGHGARSKTYQAAIVRCTGCSLVYVRNPRVAEYDESFFTGGLPNQKHREKANSEIEYLNKEFLRGRKGVKMLDVGCGPFGYHISAALDRGWEASGIDPAEAAVGIAQNHGLPVVHGTLQALQYPERSFDVVGLFATLEHFLNPRTELEKVHRVLKPNGLLYITQIPNLDSEVGELQEEEFYYIHSSHFYFFSPGSIRCFLKGIGFDVLATKSALKLQKLKADCDNKRRSARTGHVLITESTYSGLVANQEQIEEHCRGELLTVVAEKT